MKKKFLVSGLAVMAAALFILAQTNSALAQDPPKKAITINHLPKKGPVTFDHAKHSQISCAKCHHKVPGTSCFQCHKAEKGDAPKLETAMHKNCKSCHKKEGKGPTKCKDCHK